MSQPQTLFVLPGYVFPFLSSFFLMHASPTLIIGRRVHLISHPVNGNLSSQRLSSTLQMDFPLLANWSFETQFTGPGKGSWQDSWTVWFWSLRELEKPPSFMLGLFLSAMHHLDTSPLGAPLCLARLFVACQECPDCPTFISLCCNCLLLNGLIKISE